MDIVTAPPIAYLHTSDYASLCEHARLAGDDIDRGKYAIGDDALKCVTRWGETCLRDFARDINRAYSSVCEYRQVCEFWKPSARAEFAITHAVITYTHLRIAMKLADRAEEFIDFCNDNAITTDAAYKLRDQWLGKSDPDDDTTDDPDNGETSAGQEYTGPVAQVRQDVADALAVMEPDEYVTVTVKRG